MDALYRDADKLFTEIDHLDRVLDCDDLALERVELALSIAKRVRRNSTLVLRQLAEIRDQL